uniref:Sperm acrosome membrane-associated protein 4-like n=1 Tax=Phascolarctos cinereus TaxID=38626 RepID=A0A6P5IAQ5_PHACI|nr:sperm acrosome membrane-associated protein 4-like [Phascolarctos cinereus]
MRCCLIVGVALGLLLTPLIEARRCYYCDIANFRTCVGVQITCAEENDCYIGRGAVRGLPTIISKGCSKASHCGRVRHVTYMGTAYNLITSCCQAELCNMGSEVQNKTLMDVAAAAATNLSAKTFLMVLLLFLL